MVIGKNQNPWRECRTELLESEGGKLARRLSGGGTVFHDVGNLNFTFLMNREDYSVERQAGVILAAVRKLGAAAEKSGRNDLTVDGKKFSGNAFCFRKANAYHHGTILVSADMSKLSRYLQVSEEKIKSKGIESVRSRVTNLDEFIPGLTINDASEALAEAFEEAYGKSSSMLFSTEAMDQDILQELYSKYSSWEWRYGEAPRFDAELSTRFTWGIVDIGLHLENGKVKKANVYSDAMDEEFIEILPRAFEGCIFNAKALANAVSGLNLSSERQSMAGDISEWILSKSF